MTAHEPQSDQASKARLRLWLRLLKASRMVEGELRDRMRVEFGSTLPRFDVMAALSRAEGGLRMSEISGALRVSNGNVTGIVDRLVEDGLAARRAVEGDRRAMRVSLTDKGVTVFTEQAARHETWVAAMMSGLGGEDAEAFTSLLERLIENVAARDADRDTGGNADGNANGDANGGATQRETSDA